MGLCLSTGKDTGGGRNSLKVTPKRLGKENIHSVTLCKSLESKLSTVSFKINHTVNMHSLESITLQIIDQF